MRTVSALSQKGITDFLGDGAKNIAQSGCLLTSIAMAVNTFESTPRPVTPQSLNAYLRTLHLYMGSKLLVDLALKRVGIDLLHRGTFNRGDVIKHLAAKELVIVGVDYKAGASSAMSKADHFVFAYGVEEDGRIPFIDPSSGRELRFAFAPDGTTQCRVNSAVNYRAVEQLLLRKKVPK